MSARLVTVAAIVAFGLLTAAAAVADASFVDPPADQTGPPGLGPDITTVQVTSAPDGLITFRVTVSNYPTLPLTSFIAIFFDLDKNPDTGGQGDEARVGWVPDLGITFERWDGVDFVRAPDDALTAGFADGVFTLVIPRSELSGAANFAFYVGALAIADPEIGIDLAPGLDQRWHYDVVPSLVRLSASSPVFSPKRPIAGKQFSVRTVVTRSDTGLALRAGSVTCTARIGKTPLRARAGFRAQSARCAMTVPRTAKGKTLTGSLSVRAAGASVTKRFTLRVV